MDAADSGGPRPRALAGLALGIVVVVALGLRLVGLADHTLTHAEVYVPRLAMPDYVSAPPPRTTLAATVLGTLHHDNHPPGYYAGMWLWTGLAGTSLVALRLPSALAGAATVVLLFVVVRRRDGGAIALLAAAMLALHGHHVYWSQQARMWVFLGFLAVLSLERLQAYARRPRWTTAAVYWGVVAAGLWLDYSFWPFVAAQMGWLALRHRGAASMPATLDAALLAVASSAPVLWFLQVHLGLGRTEYLARTGIAEHLGEFFLFQWLIRSPPAGGTYGAASSVAILGLWVVGVVLFCAGIAAARPDAPPAEREDPGAALPWVARIAACLPPSAFVLWLWVGGERGAGAAAALASPWLVLAVGRGLERSWPAWSRRLGPPGGDAWWRRALADPAAVHCVVPTALLLGSSLLVPSVAARSLLFVTPFGLWLATRGLAALLAPPAWRAVGAAALLAAAGVSAYQYTRVEAGALDYRALAEAMRPDLRPGDTVLINDAWWTQPMHYYLPPDRYRTGTYALDPAGAERVWVVVLDPKDAAAFAGVASRLRGYGQAGRVDVPGAEAVLLRRSRGGR